MGTLFSRGFHNWCHPVAPEPYDILEFVFNMAYSHTLLHQNSGSISLQGLSSADSNITRISSVKVI